MKVILSWNNFFKICRNCNCNISFGFKQKFCKALWPNTAIWHLAELDQNVNTCDSITATYFILVIICRPHQLPESNTISSACKTQRRKAYSTDDIKTTTYDMWLQTIAHCTANCYMRPSKEVQSISVITSWLQLQCKNVLSRQQSKR